MTQEQLAEIPARLDAATPGNWTAHNDEEIRTDAFGGQVVATVSYDYDWRISREAIAAHERVNGPIDLEVATPFVREDARFIAHAPADIRALLEEVERLTEIIKDVCDCGYADMRDLFPEEGVE